MPEPYTQTIALNWRPELTFYERRTALLRSFDDEGVLRAFHVGENSVAGQLFDSRDRLLVGQAGVTLDVDHPESDRSRAWGALARACDTVRPKFPRSVQVTLQYVEPLGLSREMAVRAAYGRGSYAQGVLGHIGTESVRFGDWALLVDVAIGPEATPGQVEYGVVTRSEAHERLKRSFGRSRANPSPRPQAVNEDQLPEVGLYMSFYAEYNLVAASSDFLSTAKSFWEYSRTEAGNLIASLGSMFEVADEQEKNAG